MLRVASYSMQRHPAAISLVVPTSQCNSLTALGPPKQNANPLRAALPPYALNHCVMPAASGFADSVGDLFLLVLCLVALLARAKSLREGAVIASLALVCLAKMLLRARGRDAYLRHRVVIISAQRIAMMLCAFANDALAFLLSLTARLLAASRERGVTSCSTPP